ncbi:hypothetical protein [Paenibacillus sp.]|uniref:hypothetical protein n=1 Tax=Paenibacillus sp. TaxID=58172 RepID=UPI002D34FF14|nr:hypothetical protein [Paenibacillus sp.]HZG87462.1 hypothetical protein [Paenibacillus sp.]
MEETKKDELERVLEEALDVTKERDEKRFDTNELARERISAPYEYRVRAERDPIAEETKIIRSMAKEPDDKYDEYAKT